MAETILWDSCIIIDAIQKKEGVIEHLLPVIRRAESGDVRIVISAASIAEITYLKDLSSSMTQSEQNATISAWMNQDYVIRRNADVGVCQHGAEIARSLSADGERITPLDSIILATAIKTNANALITLDDGKNSRNSGLLALTGRFGDPGLQILTPQGYLVQSEMDI